MYLSKATEYNTSREPQCQLRNLGGITGSKNGPLWWLKLEVGEAEHVKG